MKLLVTLLVLAIVASVTQSQVIEHRSISGDKQEINAVKEYYGGEGHNIVKRDTAEESHSITQRAANEPADDDGAINIKSQVIGHRSISGDKQEINAVKEYYGEEGHNIVKRDTAEESHSIAKRAADEPADDDGAINIKEREGLNVAQPRGKKEIKLLKQIVKDLEYIEEEVQSIKDSINTGNSKLEKEVSSMEQIMDNKTSLIISKLDSINAGNSELKKEVSSMKQNIDSNNSIIISKLDSIEANQVIEPLTSLDPIHPPTTTPTGCPLGFILIDDQCYKYLLDQYVNWTDADEMCRSLGLTLAQPRDPLGIRKYLVENYGNHYTWLGARGTGLVFQWQRGGQVLSSISAYWLPGDPYRTSSDYCLAMLTSSYHLNAQPNKPYISYACTYSRYPLCEKM